MSMRGTSPLIEQIDEIQQGWLSVLRRTVKGQIRRLPPVPWLRNTYTLELQQYRGVGPCRGLRAAICERLPIGYAAYGRGGYVLKRKQLPGRRHRYCGAVKSVLALPDYVGTDRYVSRSYVQHLHAVLQFRASIAATIDFPLWLSHTFKSRLVSLRTFSGGTR